METYAKYSTSESIEFFMPMRPPTATHQMKKINWKSRAIYEPAGVKDARAKLTAHLAKHRPQKPLTGPIRLIVKWLYRRDITQPIYKPTRPDLDNAQKLLMDCMTDLGFWQDDAQIASMIIEKFWSPGTPGIYIRVESLE